MAGSSDDLLREIGRRIRVARERKGMSQAALSEAVGVQPDSIGRVERGVRWPTIATLASVAAALGVRLGDLVDDERAEPDPRERDLLAAFARLTDRQRALVVGVADEFVHGGLPGPSRKHGGRGPG